jgi:hypothetical protein
MAPASQGLGTPMAHARMGLLSRRAGHALDMAVDLGLGLPLGSEEALAREPVARLQSLVQLGRRLGPVRAMVEGGLLLRIPGLLGPEALTSSELGQELRLGVGLTSDRPGVNVEAAVRSALALGSGQGAAELLAGVRYPVSAWLEVFAMGGMGIGSLPGTPGFRLLAGASFGHPPPPERPAIRQARSSQRTLLPDDNNNDDSERPRPLRAP